MEKVARRLATVEHRLDRVEAMLHLNGQLEHRTAHAVSWLPSWQAYTRSAAALTGSYSLSWGSRLPVPMPTIGQRSVMSTLHSIRMPCLTDCDTGQRDSCQARARSAAARVPLGMVREYRRRTVVSWRT